MQTRIEIASALYRAFRDWDAQGLLAALSEDFEGEVTAGLPESLGGRYSGREAMLTQVWGRVARIFDKVHPEPSEYLEVEDDKVLVIGRYVGTARTTGKDLDASFAHLLTIENGLIRSLRQFTDSQRWTEALRS